MGLQGAKGADAPSPTHTLRFLDILLPPSPASLLLPLSWFNHTETDTRTDGCHVQACTFHVGSLD